MATWSEGEGRRGGACRMLSCISKKPAACNFGATFNQLSALRSTNVMGYGTPTLWATFNQLYGLLLGGM